LSIVLVYNNNIIIKYLGLFITQTFMNSQDFKYSEKVVWTLFIGLFCSIEEYYRGLERLFNLSDLIH